MSTATVPVPGNATGFGRNLRIFATEIRYAILLYLRTRAFSLAVIGFPMAFYIFFGLVMNRNENMSAGVSVAKYMLGSYAIFGALGASIFGIGVGVALDRSAGWLELKRASPMPPLAYVLSKAMMAMVFSVIIVCMLTALGIAFGHVQLKLAEFGYIIAIAAIAAIPFSCLGLAMAFLAPPASAGGIANLIYLPMSFLSGLWIPLKFMPAILQKIAPIFPTYHLSQMMYHALGAESHGTLFSHISSLLGFLCVMVGLAWIGFRRSEQNS